MVFAPGEIFTEIGMAVKERSPAVTLYAGDTNGLVSYFLTAVSIRSAATSPDRNPTFGLRPGDG